MNVLTVFHKGPILTESCIVLYLSRLPFSRIQKATESLRTFQPSADPCFDEFVLDTSREETLLKEMCFGGGTRRVLKERF